MIALDLCSSLQQSIAELLCTLLRWSQKPSLPKRKPSDQAAYPSRQSSERESAHPPIAFQRISASAPQLECLREQSELFIRLTYTSRSTYSLSEYLHSLITLKHTVARFPSANSHPSCLSKKSRPITHLPCPRSAPSRFQQCHCNIKRDVRTEVTGLPTHK